MSLHGGSFGTRARSTLEGCKYADDVSIVAWRSRLCNTWLRSTTRLQRVRLLALLCGVIGMACLLVQLMRDALYKRNFDRATALAHPGFPANVDEIVPNLQHLWMTPDAATYIHSHKLSPLGVDLLGAVPGDWQRLCWMDSDGDGVTNGDELGDPCCKWVPGRVPTYRVYNLTHPACPLHVADCPKPLSAEARKEINPPSCDEPVGAEIRQEQFLRQYYMLHESDLVTADGNRWLKYPALLAMVSLIGYWSLYLGLIRDLLGVGPADTTGLPGFTGLQRLQVYVAAYFWTDMVAGMTHLMFDFCPHDYPIIGNVAKGFQFHHYHPSAWTVVPLLTMLSHSFLLLGSLSIALALIPPKRACRAFWSLTFVFCFLTVLTHRWVHFREEDNYWWFRALQRTGFLMSNDHHMQHHDSLVTQFSNLSGITDPILDSITKHVLPPSHYQEWVAVTVLWFAIPIVGGAERLLPHGSALLMKVYAAENV